MRVHLGVAKEGNMNVIASIERYVTRTYSDTGQVVATCFWTDDDGECGSTSGDPASTHMLAIKTRAEREGIGPQTETW